MVETFAFVQGLKGWEWIVILVLALVLFGGAKKLPDAARGLGRSLRIFKAETKGLVSDDSDAIQGSDVSDDSDPTPAQRAPTNQRTA